MENRLQKQLLEDNFEGERTNFTKYDAYPPENLLIAENKKESWPTASKM